MKESPNLENILTMDLINELVSRGAVVADTNVYGNYKLIKKYSSKDREVFSKILILKDLKYGITQQQNPDF